MSRLILLFIGLMHLSPVVFSAPSNVHTVFTPFSITPSVEIVKSPVTRVETINVTPTITKAISPSASAVAIAGPALTTTVPVVQRIESYSSGDSSNAEIRDLLRSLLSELRGSSKSAPVFSDSYSAPPRDTFIDYRQPSYPDSFDNGRRGGEKPEKIVYVQERQPAPLIVAQQPAPLKEIVRTVYQPVYVPVQYAQPEVLAVPQPVTQTVPVVSAVPTRVKTGASAVAISTIHSSPALAIQQQQVSVPVVQSVQPVAAYASAGAALLDGGYQKEWA